MDLSKSSLKIFSANLFSSILYFFTIAYFARALGGSTLGVFFLFQALLSLLDILADFGLRGAIEKRLSEGDHQSSFIGAGILIKIALSTALITGIWLFRTYVNQYLGEQLVGLLMVALVLYGVSKLAIKVLYGELRAGETAIIRIGERITWIVSSILFVTLGFGVEGLVWGLILGYIVSLGWSAFKINIYPSIPSQRQFHSLIKYMKYNVVTFVGWELYNWTDVAILGLFVTPELVSHYELSWRIAMLVMLVANSIVTTVFPQISAWDAEGETQKIEDIASKALTICLLFTIPAFFGTVLLSSDILRFLYGTGYTNAAVVLMILVGEQIIQVFQLVYGHVLRGINLPSLSAKATAAGLTANATLNFVLISQFDILGAAIGTTTASLLGTALHWRYASKFISIDLEMNKLRWIVISSTIMTFVLWVIQLFALPSSLITFIIIVVSGVGIYAGVLFVHPAFRKMILQLIDTLRRPSSI
ncbi:flippase [Halobellus sp. EA9]|uniref:flippase n=1 Tax=Halobellus sp. EA9 TaxID=3421647 RepID=UPI003EBE0FCC